MAVRFGHDMTYIVAICARHVVVLRSYVVVRCWSGREVRDGKKEKKEKIKRKEREKIWKMR